MKYEWHLCGSANRKIVGVILEEAIIRRGDKSQRHRGEGGSQLSFTIQSSLKPSHRTGMNTAADTSNWRPLQFANSHLL